jgi:tetratricopeptide (TPR) repeat protein
MLKLIVRNHALLQHALNLLAEVGGPGSKENQYQTYPDLYPGRSGSMLPFMIRLLDCEANYILSKDLTFFFTLHSECVKTAKQLGGTKHVAQVLVNAERVFDIGSLHPEEVNSLFTDLDESKADVWYQRADEIAFSILTRQIQTREPLLGLQTISQLLPHYLNNPNMLGIIMRLYVLLGDVKAAQKALNKLESITGKDSSIAVIHQGIWLISRAEYQKALEKFESVISTDPYNISAVNNAAICLTFLRNAQRAVSILEDALFTKPGINLNETSVFNLCTLYELLSDKAMDRRRKVLQLVLDQAPDHFNLLSLRLPPGSLAPTNHPPIQP